MSSIAIRMAMRLWWASRSTTSVTPIVRVMSPIPPGCPISGHTPWGLPELESGHDRRRVDQNAVRDVLDKAPPRLPQRAIRHHPVVHAHAEVDAERDDEQDTGGRTKADDQGEAHEESTCAVEESTCAAQERTRE